MNLQPDYTLYTSDSSLERARRRLLSSEPARDHSVLNCWNPDCPTCQQWRAWARELKTVNGEIKRRNK